MSGGKQVYCTLRKENSGSECVFDTKMASDSDSIELITNGVDSSAEAKLEDAPVEDDHNRLHQIKHKIEEVPEKLKAVAHKVYTVVKVPLEDPEKIHQCCGCFFGFRLKGKCCYGHCDRCVLVNENRTAGWTLVLLLGLLGGGLFVADIIMHDVSVFEVSFC